MIKFFGKPAKLNSGAWGVRVKNPLPRKIAAGDTVTIRTRDGKEWDARIDRIVWTNTDVALCATSSRNSSTGGGGRTRPRNGTHTGEPCCCGNWSGPGSPCLYSYAEAKDADMAGYISWK